jgi:antitoxin component YwqK of YwqJK toxin-antitoxin module
MNKKIYFFLIFIFFSSCVQRHVSNDLVCVKILDRNGVSETVSIPERIKNYKNVDFTSAQPYRKVMRVFSKDITGQTSSIITTYHANGVLWQYVEGKQNRACGSYKEWHQNGSLKIDAYVVGGPFDLTISAQSEWLFDNVCKVWDENGKLIAEMTYQHGELEGLSNYYYPSGKVKKTVPYHCNKICGDVFCFKENGQMILKETYNNDKKDSLSIAYWGADLIQKIETYNEGLLDEGQYFNMQKELISEVKNGFGKKAIFKNDYLHKFVEYKNGKAEGKIEVFSKNGILKNEYFLIGGKRNGEEIKYYLNRRHCKKLSVNWKNDVLFGPVKTWYSNGNEESQKEMRQNKKNGMAYAWYKDKTLMFVEEYEDDVLKEGTYYKNNDVISRVIDGNGVAVLFDENGILLKKVKYKMGSPVY